MDSSVGSDSSPEDAASGTHRGILAKILPDQRKRFTEAERISMLRRGAWLGETTWLVPGTAAEPVNKQPDRLNVDDLTAPELAAAIKLNFVSRALVPQKRWDEARAVPEKELRTAASALLKKVRSH